MVIAVKPAKFPFSIALKSQAAEVIQLSHDFAVNHGAGLLASFPYVGKTPGILPEYQGLNFIEIRTLASVHYHEPPAPLACGVGNPSPIQAELDAANLVEIRAALFAHFDVRPAALAWLTVD